MPPTPPAEHAQAVDHGGVAVSADERVRIRHAVLRPDDLGQVFEIDLVNDATAWWNDAEVIKRALAPLQELVALAIPFEFDFRVLERGQRIGVFVHLHAVIDDEIDGHERVDALRVAAGQFHGVPHGGQVDGARHAREILQDHAGHFEGHFAVDRGFGVPVHQSGDVVGGDDEVIEIAQTAFQHHFDADGQLVERADRRQLLQIVVFDRAGGEGKRGFSTERVGSGHIRSIVCARGFASRHPRGGPISKAGA